MNTLTEFMSGSYFKHLCRYRCGNYTSARDWEFSFDVADLDNDRLFIKTELLPQLIQMIQDGRAKLPPVTLLTHNSDINITSHIANYVLSSLDIVEWYAQNLNFVHPKIRSLPIGIANPKWEHGSTLRFNKIIAEGNHKSNLTYVNFNIRTNPIERLYFLRQLSIDIPLYPDCSSPEEHNAFCKATQDEYLRDMARSYFVVSPNGNGLDCHKTWEAIYMGSVPIITRSVMAEEYEKKYPVLVIDDWADYKNLPLSAELYEEIMRKFDGIVFDWDYHVRG